MWRIRSNTAAFVVCLVGCVSLLLTQWSVPEPVGGIVVTLEFLGTLLLAGILGGWKAGLTTNVLCILLALFLFRHPFYERIATKPVELFRLVSFAVLGVILSAVCELLHRAWRRVEDRQRQLEAEVNERRRAQAAEQARTHELLTTLASIGESIDYGVWVCDSSGRNTYASESFLRLVGLPQEALTTSGGRSLIHPDDVESVLAAWKKCVHRGQRWDREMRVRDVEGRWHYILSRGVPMKNEQGEVTSWVGINLDIDHLKEVEQEIRENDRRKDEFLATLAHELRNPLAPIVNSLQILKMPGIDADTSRQTQDMIGRQVHQLARLVEDLLDASRLMQGKIELRREHVDLAVVVSRAVETVQPLIKAQAHRLHVELPPEPMLVDGDSVRLAQVIGNLLGNSAKYTEQNGQIRLIVGEENGQAVIRISDNGIGIAPEMLPHIFELFVQADQSSTKSQGGLGIGLTLVKNLVEMHGGKVEAHSAGLGQGSEFVVRLPLATTRLHTSKPSSHEHETMRFSSAGLRLLVVDDNIDAANSLAMLLRLRGHEVRVTHNGNDALRAAEECLPDLVLLDIGMPMMDGFEVLRRMRTIPGMQDTKVVALTGWGQAEHRRRTLESGFDDHLLKPPDPRLLEQLLAQVKDSLCKT